MYDDYELKAVVNGETIQIEINNGTLTIRTKDVGVSLTEVQMRYLHIALNAAERK